MTAFVRRPLRAALALGIILALAGMVSPRIADAHSPSALSPVVSVTPNVVTVGSTALVHGTDFTPNNRVFVSWRRPDGTTAGIWLLTDATGMFSLRLGFLLRHGTGVELVTAFDFATNRRAPAVPVIVNLLSTIEGQLFASPNPVMDGGFTVISGTGFMRNTRVRVRWSRPDGTQAAVDIFTNSAGRFAFRLFAAPGHGCGMRVFVATDLVTGAHTAPLSLGETC